MSILEADIKYPKIYIHTLVWDTVAGDDVEIGTSV